MLRKMRVSSCVIVLFSISASGCWPWFSGGENQQGICGDGRQPVDIEQVALKYDRMGFSITGSWQGIAVTVGVKPEQVQKIQETTQNWNEYIKGAALAHNGCSGARDRFGKLLERYDALKKSKELLVELIKSIPANENASPELQTRLKEGFDNYFKLVNQPV
ncbi:MAG: hypothetical protein EPO61_01725 [Nitrospirae bacterium]|nr:MAG: hypothetical protein EPO61_01725 [Nitrospirota bacterium]